ncbi:MFS transporter [Candidatus Bathyarchaeota archaeon]|nr:MFS transporter [Candidatus Bathyarchaeota archaeon]
MDLQQSQTTFKHYLLFLSGQFTSMLGSSVAQFVIVWWITLETKSAVYLSITSFAAFTPLVVLIPFTGVFADRWNRKILIGVTDFLQALIALILIVLFWFNVISIWTLIVLIAIRSVFQAFQVPVVSTLIPLMVPSDKLSRINGLNFLLSGIVGFIGPVTAAMMLEIWTICEILWLDVVTFLIAIIPLTIIKIPTVKTETSWEKASFTRDFIEGLTFIKHTKGFMAVLMTAMMINFLAMPLDVLLPYYIRFTHQGEASELAFVMAASQVGMLLGGVLMSVIRGFKRKILTAMHFLYVFFAMYALIALSPKGFFWLIASAMFTSHLCLPIINVSFITVVQTIVPKHLYGRVSSVMMTLCNLASPVGMIISGPLAVFTGIVNLFLGCSMLGALCLTLSVMFTDIRYVEEMNIANY